MLSTVHSHVFISFQHIPHVLGGGSLDLITEDWQFHPSFKMSRIPLFWILSSIVASSLQHSAQTTAQKSKWGSTIDWYRTFLSLGGRDLLILWRTARIERHFFLTFSMCLCQLRWLSTITPRYFIALLTIVDVSSRCTGEVSYLQFVEVAELCIKVIQGGWVLCQAWHPCWQYTHISCESPCLYKSQDTSTILYFSPLCSTSSSDTWYSSIQAFTYVRIEWCPSARDPSSLMTCAS